MHSEDLTPEYWTRIRTHNEENWDHMLLRSHKHLSAATLQQATTCATSITCHTCTTTSST